MAAANMTRVKFIICFLMGMSSILLGIVKAAKFDELFKPNWATDHLISEGEVLKLKLDHYSGAGFQSKSKFMFGKISAQIKLVEGDSAGTVTAFYMSSDGPYHNEFDYEFLGNTTGEPYLVQTNVFVNGVGDREQRLSLWFDPTKEFHTYSLLWNQHQVVFMIDETPIRVHTNMEHKGIAFPKDQAMGVYSSIWNADDWATQGGRVKTNWSNAPFIATYKEFEIDACEVPVTTAAADGVQKCGGGGENTFWWDEPAVSELSVHQSHQLMWVKAKHLVYDYCTDGSRFAVAPVECQHHHHLQGRDRHLRRG